ncbi:UDP-N-acetylmuramoyl-L-alanine--D-glutamate ligase [Candidatus Margulisiibacteriota bacterium]
MTPEKNKRISIIGLGVSGLAVLEKLSSLGADLFLSEAKPRDKIDKKILRKIDSFKINAEFGKHTSKILDGAGLIVVSPGVDTSQSVLRRAAKKRIQIISEVELASQFLKKPVIAVTGTNGKTTTVELIVSLLKSGKLKTVAAGNIGYPLMSVNDSRIDCIVAEISSYQLENIVKFKPYISVILNITEDHLMRHKNMEKYSLSKARIFENQKEKDCLIYNIDDPLVKGISGRAKCIKIPFSIQRKLKKGIYVDDGRIISLIHGKKMEICKASEIKLRGLHNLQNALAAAASALVCGVSAKDIKRALMAFKGVEHRIEYVSKIKGVSFYNDSKATNPDSAIVAVNALYPDSKIVLILGGEDKKTSLSELSSVVKKKVKEVVLIGKAAKRFKKDLGKAGFRRVTLERSMKDAVKRSFQLAESGDTVLLSPACASFDMFSNFEERGEVFKKSVEQLAGSKK